MKLRRRNLITTFLALLITCMASAAIAQQATTVEVELGASVTDKPVTGRLLVFVSKQTQQPIKGPNWFSPEPFFGMEVKEMSPGDAVTLDDSAESFPAPISKLPAGTYFIQAVLDHGFYYANHADGPGNFYGDAVRVKIGEGPVKVQLKLDKVIKAKKYEDNQFCKFVEIKSELLSKFHGREVLERALVVLPRSYESQPEKRYPVYIDITGFGGTLSALKKRWSNGPPRVKEGQAEFIRVYLTGQCKWGHHVYANSATNGPRGDALIKEMIPEIDKRFRTISKSTARFVGGHSSGGWSSLWLQVAYPDSFGGVWSTAPDPVDFRDWQGTNIYEESANVFFDKDGKKKPLARFGGRVVAQYADFTKMDDVMGRGGQIRSFDAVFSPLQETGPAHAWDRNSGKVNPDIVEYWKRYDISLKLKENWSELGSKLKTKLHVYMGDTDTFYLEGATILLGERLKKLGSDAVVEIFPGKDHMNLLTPKMNSRIMTEMSEQFWKHHPENK